MSAPVPADEFQPGFRCSVSDVAILAGGTWAALEVPIAGAWIGIAVGHFFLFCNVLRLPRRLELVWAAACVALATVSLQPNLAALACTTLAVTALAIRQPSYHGVLWRRVNPRLRAWWDARRRVNSAS